MDVTSYLGTSVTHLVDPQLHKFVVRKCYTTMSQGSTYRPSFPQQSPNMDPIHVTGKGARGPQLPSVEIRGGETIYISALTKSAALAQKNWNGELELDGTHLHIRRQYSAPGLKN